MSTPHYISFIPFFLGSVQFYGKFLPPHISTVGNRGRTIVKAHSKKFPGKKTTLFNAENAFIIKQNNVLDFFDPILTVDIFCGACNEGFGVVFFHRWVRAANVPQQMPQSLSLRVRATTAKLF